MPRLFAKHRSFPNHKTALRMVTNPDGRSVDGSEMLSREALVATGCPYIILTRNWLRG
jgi:hypothetical protein